MPGAVKKQFTGKALNKRTVSDAFKENKDHNEIATRAEQKKLKKERKLAKPYGQEIESAKKLWEKARLKDCPSADRKKHVNALFESLNNRFQKIASRIDGCRMMQTLIKYGTKEQRQDICTQLKGQMVEMAKSKFGKFVIVKLLRHLPAERETIIAEFSGSVAKLLRHRDASVVVEAMYSEFSNAQQRMYLIREFYGPEFILFKDQSAKNFASLIAEYPEKKEAIAKSLQENLVPIFSKPLEHLQTCSIVHRAFYDFVQVAERSAILEMADLAREQLINMVHTVEGSRAVRACILHAGAKERKLLLRCFKGFVDKMAMEPHSYIVLLTIFSCVDDTVLVNKLILAELVKSLKACPDLLLTKYGSRVLLFLLGGRNRRYISIDCINELEIDDAIAEETSRKDATVRQNELCSFVLQPLIEALSNYLEPCLRDRFGAEILVEVLCLQRQTIDRSSLYSGISDSVRFSKVLDGELLTKDLASQLEKLLPNSANVLFNIQNSDDDGSDHDEAKAEFHPVKALSKVSDSKVRAAIIEHFSLNKPVMKCKISTRCIKTAVKNNLEFAQKLAESLSHDSVLSNYMDYVLENYTVAVGTALVFISLLETGDASVVELIKPQLKQKLPQVERLTRKLKEDEYQYLSVFEKALK